MLGWVMAMAAIVAVWLPLYWWLVVRDPDGKPVAGRWHFAKQQASTLLIRRVLAESLMRLSLSLRPAGLSIPPYARGPPAGARPNLPPG